MAVMFALAQSLMKYRGGWDAVKLKGKGVKVRCKVSVWRSARPEPSYLKLMAVRAGVSAEDLLGCVFAARPPSTASLPTS